jgi:starch-binding outer membrane protein, SusD/RagB family
MSSVHIRSPQRSRRGLFLLGAVASLAMLAACSDLLDVPAPSQIPADQLESPGNASLLVSGAMSDFDCALGSFIVMGGLITDELEDGTETAARWVYDRREVAGSDALYATSDCTGIGTYTPLNKARASADNSFRLLEGWTDEQMPSGVSRTELMANAAAYGGYARVLIAEMFCQSVISRIEPDQSITYGPVLTKEQMLQSADSTLTAALALATQAGDQQLVNMILVGRARARLDMGDAAAAKADADLVPPDFVYYASAASRADRQHNRVFDASNPISGSSASVDTQYYRMHDPRVPVDSTGRTTGRRVLFFAQTKYTSADTPIPIASGKEAQLISAEGDIAAGQYHDAVLKMNAIRADRYSMAPYAGPEDEASVRALLVEERRRDLFLEGQRLGDVQRFNVALKPAPGAAFVFGGTYGTTTCLPLPDAEAQANPNTQ